MIEIELVTVNLGPLSQSPEGPTLGSATVEGMRGQDVDRIFWVSGKRALRSSLSDRRMLQIDKATTVEHNAGHALGTHPFPAAQSHTPILENFHEEAKF